MRNTSIFLILASFLTLSCQKDVRLKGSDTPGNGVTISLCTAITQTKAALGDGVVADGGGIYLGGSPEEPDLSILLFDDTGALSAYYPGANSSFEIVTRPEDILSSATEVSVTFTATASGAAFANGSYSLYAIANTAGLWSMTDGSNTYANWSAVMTALQGGMTEATFKTLKFTQLSEHVAPAVQNSRLPMSAVGSVVIRGGQGHASAELLRCVSKVNVSVVNNTSSSLDITGLKFGEFNPASGFLIPQTGSDVPANVPYSDLTLIDSANPATIAAGDTTKVVTDKYLFPGAAGRGQYLLELAFGAPYYILTYSLGDEITLGDAAWEGKEYYILFHRGTERKGFAYFDPSRSSGTRMGVEAADGDNVPQSAFYRWVFQPGSSSTTDCPYHIMNVGTGDYIMASDSEDMRVKHQVNTDKYSYYIISSGKTAPSDYYWRIGGLGGEYHDTHNIKHSQLPGMENPYSSWQLITLSRGLTSSNEDTNAYVTTAYSTFSELTVYEASTSQDPFAVSAPIRSKATSEDIAALGRNQNLDIIVTVTGNGVKIPFDVVVWTAKVEHVHFD